MLDWTKSLTFNKIQGINISNKGGSAVNFFCDEMYL